MLRNVVDIDFAAQTVSIKHRRGAILLFDFKAAFPSLSHDFLWETLAALGLPGEFIRALQMFYIDNKHILRIGGIEMESVVVLSGVRQGCPLSPILFALCSDILLREIDAHLHGDEALRAFADDTGAVISDYVKTLPGLQQLFHEFGEISMLKPREESK